MPSTGNLIKTLCPRRSQGLRGNYYGCLVMGMSNYYIFGYSHRLVLPSPMVGEALFSSGQWLVVKMRRTSGYRVLSSSAQP